MDANIAIKPAHAVSVLRKTIRPQKMVKIAFIALKHSASSVQGIMFVVSIKLVRIQTFKNHQFLDLNASSALWPIALIAKVLINVKNVQNHRKCRSLQIKNTVGSVLHGVWNVQIITYAKNVQIQSRNPIVIKLNATNA